MSLLEEARQSLEEDQQRRCPCLRRGLVLGLAWRRSVLCSVVGPWHVGLLPLLALKLAQRQIE